MIRFFGSSALWHLISQSDVVSKIVLLVLFIMSIVCWALFFYRLRQIRQHERDLRAALQVVREIRLVSELLAAAQTMRNTLAHVFIAGNITFFERLTGTKKELMDAIGVSDQEYEALQDNADQIFDDIMHEEESHLPFFAASAAVSPLLGLFGTVWGLIQAFIGMSERQSADISSVAPGLAEALITTLVGLMVAIPALIMFHYLDVRIKNISQHAKAFSDRILMIIGVSSRARGEIS